MIMKKLIKECFDRFCQRNPDVKIEVLEEVQITVTRKYDFEIVYEIPYGKFETLLLCTDDASTIFQELRDVLNRSEKSYIEYLENKLNDKGYGKN